MQEKQLREGFLRHDEDPLLARLRESYLRAVEDRADLLTHLYEIRDALGKHFGGDKQAKRSLRISDREWSKLGKIANHEPVLESRHRGSHFDGLRPATPDEVDQSLTIALEMIQKYLDHLENCKSTGP
jgi:hypothetical protein